VVVNLWRVRVDRDVFFDLSISSTRGHPYKLFKHFRAIPTIDQTFSERVVKVWNILPVEQIDLGLWQNLSAQ